MQKSIAPQNDEWCKMVKPRRTGYHWFKWSGFYTSVMMRWSIEVLNFVCQAAASRYLENIDLKEEIDGTKREMGKQERELDALRSQVGEVELGLPRRTTVRDDQAFIVFWYGGIMRAVCWAQVIRTTISVDAELSMIFVGLFPSCTGSVNYSTPFF